MRRGSREELYCGVVAPDVGRGDTFAWPRLKNQREPRINAASASVSTEIGFSESLLGGDNDLSRSRRGLGVVLSRSMDRGSERAVRLREDVRTY